MEDREIVGLYFARDESAIRETDAKYGAFCRHIARNILTLREDAEECVNDTWHTAWNRMPPTLPASLKAFLGRITRDLAIDRFRASHAQKRYDGMELLLSELGDCVPGEMNVERQIEIAEIAGSVQNWLSSLKPEDRALFLRRYWYGDTVKELAMACGLTQNQAAQRLRKLRLALRAALGEEMTV